MERIALGGVGFVHIRICRIFIFPDSAGCASDCIVYRRDGEIVPLRRNLSCRFDCRSHGGLRHRLFLVAIAVGRVYGVGKLLFDHVFSVESFDKVSELYNRYNFWIIFTAGFTPLPYKLFTITGGLFHIDFAMFIIASIVSRGLRFFLFAALIWKFGGPIKTFIDKYFNILAILFTVILIGSFILVGKLV